MKLGLFMLLIFPYWLISQTCVTISDGTYGNSQTTPLAPIYGLYDYSWSSSIYRAADIGAAKTIGSIAWYIDGFQSGYSQTGPYTFNNVQIYFAYTTLSGWASTNNVSGVNRLTGVNVAQGITSWTKVFDGSFTFNASDAWKTITLTSPFSYDGATNLIVHVDNNDGSYASGYPIFHYTNYNTATSTRTMKYGAQDGSMGPTSGTRLYARPDIKFCTTSALPIELLDFKPTYKNGVVNIKWVTASEKNNDYFTIEKTINGVSYETIDTVDAVGNSQTISDYNSFDYDLNSSVIYYRLKQTDIDGKNTITDWYSVNIIDEIKNITVTPNPFSDNINIMFDSDIRGPQIIYITDLMGKVLHQEEINISMGSNYFNIKLENFDKGIYLLNFNKIIFKIENE